MSEPVLQDDFRMLWEEHKFEPGPLSLMARLPIQIVLRMLRYQPVHRGDAECILSALARIMDKNYSLSTVRVPLLDEDGKGNNEHTK